MDTIFKKIHHIAIICSDYEKSKNFYTNILGFEILEENYRAERKSYKLDLAVNGVYQIELFSFPVHPPRKTNPEACGLRHIAFEVENIDVAISVIAEKGVATEPVRVDEVTGKKFTFFRDPDQLPIEIYEIQK